LTHGSRAGLLNVLGTQFGLGLMMLGFLLSSVVPDVWWLVIGAIVCGLALGTMLAYGRRHKPMATDGRIHTGQLKDLFA